MLTEQGIVKQKKHGYATVTTIRKSMCSHCLQKDSCTNMEECKDTMVEVLNDFNAKIGDRVLIAISHNTLTKATFLTYFLPILSMITGGLLGNFLFYQWFDYSKDIITILSSFLFLGTSMAIVIFFSKKKKVGESFRPKIIKIFKNNIEIIK